MKEIKIYKTKQNIINKIINNIKKVMKRKQGSIPYGFSLTHKAKIEYKYIFE